MSYANQLGNKYNKRQEKVDIHDKRIRDFTEQDVDKLLKVSDNLEVETTEIDIPQPSTTIPLMDGVASAGTEETWARGDHIHPADTSKADIDHTHGSITNDGKITSDTSISSGDKLVIIDSSDNNSIKASSISFGDGSSTYLQNDGSWGSPNYKLTYDELSSAGYAEVGIAQTGEPNYTPSGTVDAALSTEKLVVMTDGTAALTTFFSNCVLTIDVDFTPNKTTKNIITGIDDINFIGNGVKFAIEQEI